MIAKLRHTVRQATALMVLLLAFASCSSKGDLPEDPGTVYKFGFYVNVGDNAGASRATPTDGEYHPGSGWENHIDIAGGDIRVVLFNTDNTFLTEITDFQITPLASYESSKLYYINAGTKVDISDGKFKIVIVANWGTDNYPTVWNFDNIFSITYSFQPGKPLGADNLIPLYGVKSIAISGGIRPNIAADLGTIHLLRAMAKVEVLYSDDLYTIKSLHLRNYNGRGYCAPVNVTEEEQYVKHNWNNDYTSLPSIPVPPMRHEETLAFNYVGKDGSGRDSYVLYVPEYSNLTSPASDPTPPSIIEISFNEGFGDTRTITFRNGDVPCDILRNVWYRFIVTKKSEESDIQVEVDVLPYRVIELNPDFGLDIE